MIPRIIIDDLIGKSFILSNPPLEFHIKNKGVHVDKEHPFLIDEILNEDRLNKKKK